MMDSETKGPVQREIEQRLTARLAPEMLVVINDSDSHRGHAGHDGAGESHFSVEIVAAAFVGHGRVARQRMINHALGDLMEGKIHALAISARTPQEHRR